MSHFYNLIQVAIMFLKSVICVMKLSDLHKKHAGITGTHSVVSDIKCV